MLFYEGLAFVKLLHPVLFSDFGEFGFLGFLFLFHSPNFNSYISTGDFFRSDELLFVGLLGKLELD